MKTTITISGPVHVRQRILMMLALLEASASIGTSSCNIKIGLDGDGDESMDVECDDKTYTEILNQAFDVLDKLNNYYDEDHPIEVFTDPNHCGCTHVYSVWDEDDKDLQKSEFNHYY